MPAPGFSVIAYVWCSPHFFYSLGGGRVVGAGHDSSDQSVSSEGRALLRRLSGWDWLDL